MQANIPSTTHLRQGATARVPPMRLPTRPGPSGGWGTALLVHARGPSFSYRTSTVFKARTFFFTPPDPCPWSPKECHLPELRQI